MRMFHIANLVITQKQCRCMLNKSALIKPFVFCSADQRDKRLF